MFLPAMVAHAVVNVHVDRSIPLFSWINVEVRLINRMGQLSPVHPTGNREDPRSAPRQRGTREKKFARQSRKKRVAPR